MLHNVHVAYWFLSNWTCFRRQRFSHIIVCFTYNIYAIKCVSNFIRINRMPMRWEDLNCLVSLMNTFDICDLRRLNFVHLDFACQKYSFWHYTSRLSCSKGPICQPCVSMAYRTLLTGYQPHQMFVFPLGSSMSRCHCKQWFVGHFENGSNCIFAVYPLNIVDLITD